MKISLPSVLRCGMVALGALISLGSTAWAQNNMDPDGVNAMKNLIANYQKMTSYAEDTIVIVNTPGPGETMRANSHNCSLAWQRDEGLRIEGEKLPATFVVRSDGKQVHTHYLKYAEPDSDSPTNGNTDFLSQPMPSLPFDFPDIGIITGGVSVETLRAMHFNSVSYIPHVGFAGATGPIIKCYSITLDYNDAAGRHITLRMSVGEDDDLLHFSEQKVEFGTTHYSISTIHSNIQPGADLPKAYWDSDFPLMRDIAPLADLPPLHLPGIAPNLPIITARDISGKIFKISPENKKIVFFYFFFPIGARFTIDDVQQLSEEGEARGFQVVGIVQNVGPGASRTQASVQAFLSEHHVTFPVVFQENPDPNDIAHQLGSTGVGNEFLYGRDGKLLTDTQIADELKLRPIMNAIAPIPGR